LNTRLTATCTTACFFVNVEVLRSVGILQAMMAAWQNQCGKLDQYGMQYSRLFANLCNAGISTETLAGTAAHTCPTLDATVKRVMSVS
jgi:hypothetical protein